MRNFTLQKRGYRKVSVFLINSLLLILSAFNFTLTRAQISCGVINTLYQTVGNGTNAQVFRYNRFTKQYVLVGTLQGATSGSSSNSAYNTITQYIYSSEGVNAIKVYDPANNFNLVGIINITGNSFPFNNTLFAQGNFVGYINSNRLIKFDVTGISTYPANIAVNQTTITPGIGTAPNDFSLIGGFVYGMAGTTLNIVNTTTGALTTRTMTIDNTLDGVVNGTGWGASWQDIDGNYYAFNNTNGDIYRTLNVASPLSTSLVKIALAAPSNSNDGFGCELNPNLFDLDGDGLLEDADLDDDNDGILDTNESGGTGLDPGADQDGDLIPNYADANIAGFVDTNSDGINDNFDADKDGTPDEYDLDSDNDGCKDVREAGYMDGDDNGTLGSAPDAVDGTGKITGYGGYTGTNANVTTAGLASTINTSPSDQTKNEGENVSFSVNASGGSGTTQYQWQESTNNGTTWNNISNGGIYSGATTTTLTLTGVPISINGYDYRAEVTQSNFVCANVQSTSANLIVNGVPVANDDIVATLLTEDGANGTVSILSNDADPNGNPSAPTNGVGQFTVDLDPLTIGIQTTITNTTGVWTYNTATGVVTFDPGNNYNGSSTISYELCDAGSPALCDQANITFTVNAVNDNPTASNDLITGVEDTPITVNIITNDSDLDGTIDPTTVDLNPGLAGIQTTFTVSGQGVYTVNASGIVTFTPVLNFNGIATTINYTVQDNLGATSNIATITITVTASGPSFNCSDKAFLIQDNPSKLYEVNLITGVSTIVMNPVSGTDEFNGLAYNPKDGFLYAKKLGAGELIRIAADYTTAIITIPGLPAAGRVVGDIDTAGIYYLTTGTSTTLNRIDLNSSSLTNATLLPSVTLPSGGLGTLDIGISYVNNKGYAITSGAAPHILKELNLSTGAITSIGTVTGGGSESENTAWGAAYMDLAGNFYFGSNNTGNIYKIKQPHLLTPGAVTSQFFSFGPISSNNDGARCGYAPVNIDFGDAPSSYGILLNANGARHGVASGLSIGASNDADDDGIAGALANGDDSNGSDDEDGLTSSIIVSPLATTFTLTVPVTNTSFATAKLFGWIDFNLDGIFQTSEGTSVAAPSSSSVTLTWNSITPTIGTSYLRLRLSSDANLTTSTPNGAMQNGEVEDYLITIANSSPVANDDVVGGALTEDGANGTVNIISNDTDADGNPTAPTNGVGQFTVDIDPLTVGIQTTLANATGVWTYDTATGVVTFDPANNFNGSSTIVYDLCDVGAPVLCDQANITFTVNSVNDSPIANDDIVVTALTEDGANGTVNIVTNDTDVDGNPTVPTNGVGQFTVDLNTGLAGIQTTITNAEGVWTYNTTTGVVTFDPANDFNGTATLPYELCDVGIPVLCDQANITFTVNSVNDTPNAVDNIVAVPLTEDGANGTVNIISNDTDADGNPTAPTNGVGQFTVDIDPLTVGIQTTLTNANGVWTYDTAAGVVTFDPANNFNGSSTIVYDLCDVGAPVLCDQANITFTVNAVNDAPLANDDIVVTALSEDGANGTVNIITNDTDIDGNPSVPTNGAGLFRVDLNPLTAGIQTSLTNTAGIWTYNSATGVVTFDPANNFNGTATLPYELCDPGTPRLCDQANITFTVTAVNDGPVVDNENVTGSEDTDVTGDLTDGGDSDVDGNLVVNVTPVSGPSNGVIVINLDGTYTYTPDENFNGSDTIVVEICDDGTPLPALCINDTIFITIDPVNDAPVIDNEFISVAQNQSASGDLTNAGDLDPDGTNLVVNTTSVSGPNNGGITINSDGTFTYTPDLGFIGFDTVVVEICDEGLPLPVVCVNDTIFINVLSTTPPVAENDSIITLEDQEIIFNITDNDTDVDGTINVSAVDLDPSTVGIQNTVTTTEGIWTVDNLGNVTFTPAQDFNGDATIDYTVNDNDGATSNIGSITVSVTAVNDGPVVDNENVTGSEDTDVAGDLTDGGDSDVDGNLVVNVTPVSGPSNGVIVINLDGTYTYTPDENFNGSDTIVVEICDDGTPLPALCINDTIFITIDPVNDAPVIDNEFISVAQNQSASGDLTNAGDSDPDGTNLVVNTAPIINPANGSIVINSDGSYTYTPDLDYIGNDTIVVEICDEGLPLPVICINDTIFILVTDAIPPIAEIDSVITLEDTDLTFNITDNDTDIDGTIDGSTVDLDVLTSGIQNTITTPEGFWTVDNLGNVTFTPVLNFNGTATLTYTVNDNDGLTSNISEIVVTVTPVNDTPVIDNESVTTTEDSAVSGDLTDGGDSDVDGNLVVNTIPVTGPFNGEIVINVDGSYTYTPNVNFNGTDTIVVEICDDGTPLPIICVNDTIFIFITPVNDLQSQGNETIVVVENTSETNINILDNNIDPDNDLLTVTTNVLSAQGGAVTINSDGTINYTPAEGFIGLDTIFYSVCDTALIPNCVNDTLFITVEPDADGDGIVNSQDIDNDNDGIPDTKECLTSLNDCDTDGDGVLDIYDLDSDNDGISDIFEAGGSLFDTNNDGVIDNSIDVDQDGLFDVADASTEGGIDLPVPDTDGDSRPDFQDLDSDNDGINDLTESGNNLLADLDSDGIVDGPDTDGDGINDSADPDNGGILSDPVDIDFDGHPDFQDLDSDNDGINDIVESGNEVIDANNDGVVDGPDTDGDGINDSSDANDTVFGDPDTEDKPLDTDNDGNPDYNDLDSDNDGIKDVVENGNGDLDSDGDGRVDGEDSDGDGILDPVDGNDNTFGDAGTDNDPIDTDGDGKPNYVDLDSDGDGINDGIDNELTTEDCDSDGLSNYLDPDPCGIFIPQGFSPNGDGVNDVLVIRGIDQYPDNKFFIFNRWGNKVLDAQPYTNNWDGKSSEGLRIGEDVLPVGTYFYVLDLGDGSEVYKGYIYLNK